MLSRQGVKLWHLEILIERKVAESETEMGLGVEPITVAFGVWYSDRYATKNLVARRSGVPWHIMQAAC